MTSEYSKSNEHLDELNTLRTRQDNLQALFPVIITSLKSKKVLFINEVASEFFGVSEDMAVGLEAEEYWYSPNERHEFIKELQNKGKVTEYESCLLTNTGEKKFVLLYANLTSYHGEEATYTTFTDITPRKKAEQLLQQSQKKIQGLYSLMKRMSDTVPDLIWAKDLNDCYLFANKVICEKLLKCGENESPIGKTDLFFARRERERGQQHTFGEICINSDGVVKSTRKAGRFLEDGLVRGEYLVLDVNKAPLFDDNGELIGTVGAGRDVTQDMKTQDILKKSETMYKLLADNVRDVIWTTDSSLNITYATPSIIELTGYTPDEFIRLPKEAQLPPPFRKPFRVITRYLLREARKGGPTTRLWEFQWQHKDGRILWVETSTSAIYTEQGEFSGFVCVTRETTKKVHAQQELEEAKEEALTASQAKSEFLANMSHEIRTPMNGVLGMLQLLQKTSLNDEQAGYVDTALSSGTSLLTVISDILDFSKIEAGKIDLEKRQFSLNSLSKSTIASFENLVDTNRVSLQLHAAEALTMEVVGDETRIRQILFNLIGNAVKFTEKGRIDVYLTHNKISDKIIRLNFTICDTGIGITEEKIATLFEPFVQADGSFRRRYTGTGLGLSIVKRLVDLMGGSININSIAGKGTEVCFSLEVELAMQKETAESHVDGEETSGIKQQRILVVEDENINALVVTSMLKKLGHLPTLVNNGQQALEILHKQTFDCVLMDIQMPQMDGIETAREIRKNSGLNSSTVPIIALTAHAMKGDRERFLDAGMNDYLTKPVEMTDLIEVLQVQSTSSLGEK